MKPHSLSLPIAGASPSFPPKSYHMHSAEFTGAKPKKHCTSPLKLLPLVSHKPVSLAQNCKLERDLRVTSWNHGTNQSEVHAAHKSYDALQQQANKIFGLLSLRSLLFVVCFSRLQNTHTRFYAVSIVLTKSKTSISSPNRKGTLHSGDVRQRTNSAGTFKEARHV